MLGPGSRVAVLLPPHWRTAAVLLGAWAAGLAVSFRPRATAGLPVLEPGGDRPFDAVFVTPERQDDWLEDVPDAPHRYLVGTGPGRLADVPLGWLDWSAEVLRHPATSHPTTPPSTRRTRPARTAPPTASGVRSPRRSPTMLDLRAGDRLLVDAAETEQPLKWLLAPLSAGASVVISRQPRPGAAGRGRRRRAGDPGPLNSRRSGPKQRWPTRFRYTAIMPCSEGLLSDAVGVFSYPNSDVIDPAPPPSSKGAPMRRRPTFRVAVLTATAVDVPGVRRRLRGARHRRGRFRLPRCRSLSARRRRAQRRPGPRGHRPGAGALRQNQANAYGVIKDAPRMPNGAVHIRTVFHVVSDHTLTTAEHTRMQT